MNRVTKELAERGRGEHVSEEYHYPKYTKGCWGRPSERKCWICKVRAPIRIAKVAKRIRDS